MLSVRQVAVMVLRRETLDRAGTIGKNSVGLRDGLGLKNGRGPRVHTLTQQTRRCSNKARFRQTPEC